jgi:hypothetical protein
LVQATRNLTRIRNGLQKVTPISYGQETVAKAREYLIAGLAGWPSSDSQQHLRSPEGIRAVDLGHGRVQIVAQGISKEGFDYTKAVEEGRKAILLPPTAFPMVFMGRDWKTVYTWYVRASKPSRFMAKTVGWVRRTFRPFMEVKVRDVIQTKGAKTEGRTVGLYAK